MPITVNSTPDSSRAVRDLSDAARDGYTADPGAKNPHLWSSAMWLAFEAGRALQAAGEAKPRKVKAGRGFSIRAITIDHSSLAVVFRSDLESWTIVPFQKPW